MLIFFKNYCTGVISRIVKMQNITLQNLPDCTGDNKWQKKTHLETKFCKKKTQTSILTTYKFISMTLEQYLDHFKSDTIWDSCDHRIWDYDMTQSQLVWSFESQGVSKILTACRMLQISIALCQIKAEIHSFPTMYIIGGGKFGLTRWKKCLKPKISPKTRFFGGHKYGLSHFRVAWDPKF